MCFSTSCFGLQRVKCHALVCCKSAPYNVIGISLTAGMPRTSPDLIARLYMHAPRKGHGLLSSFTCPAQDLPKQISSPQSTLTLQWTCQWNFDANSDLTRNFTSSTHCRALLARWDRIAYGVKPAKSRSVADRSPTSQRFDICSVGIGVLHSWSYSREPILAVERIHGHRFPGERWGAASVPQIVPSRLTIC